MVTVVKAARIPVPPARLRGAIAAAAELAEVGARLPRGGWDLAVRVSGDRELLRLNRQFLGEDHSTDVLSFPSGDTAPGAHLGDIVISWPAVRRQAAEFAHPEESELLLLVVHGFLHVLGWDHATPAEGQEMTRLTVAALGRAGVAMAAGRLLEGGQPG